MIFSPDRARVDAANVRREEHDGGVQPAPQSLPHRSRHLPRSHVDEGGRRTDAQHPEQELVLLCRVDPEQREDGRLRHPAARPQDGSHFHRQFNSHPGAVQADIGTVHCHVQA